MTKPDFICIGTQKAATSWLYMILRENPGIWLTPIKELHFFDRALRPDENRIIGEREKKIIKKRIRETRKSGAGRNEKKALIEYLTVIGEFDSISSEWYEYIFSSAAADGKVKGEITPAYIDMPEENIAFMRSYLTDTKLLLIVRSPLERMLSQVRMHVERRDESPDSEQEWKNLYKRMRNKEDRGHYQRGITAFKQQFPAEQLMIVPFGNVKSDPKGLIDRIETYLGVPHHDGYTYLNEVRHKSKKVDIPEWLVETMRADTQAEKDFLIREFGEEFYRQTV